MEKNISKDKDEVDDTPTDSLAASLKKLLVQCTSLGSDATQNNTKEQKTLSTDDKEFLENALASSVKPRPEGVFNQIINSLNPIWNSSVDRDPSDEELEILENLEEITEDPVLGDTFISVNGIEVCHKILVSTSNNSVIIHTCNIIANISLNNPVFHSNENSHALLEQLLAASAKVGISPQAQIKLLYAASCILSSNEEGVARLLKSPHGLQNVFSIYEKNDNFQVRRRVSRIISSIFKHMSHENNINIEQTYGFCESLCKNWWAENNSYIFINIQVLHSIFSGKNKEIASRIREKLNSEVHGIIMLMEGVQERKESENCVVRDEEEGLETLKEFKKIWESRANEATSKSERPLMLL